MSVNLQHLRAVHVDRARDPTGGHVRPNRLIAALRRLRDGLALARHRRLAILELSALDDRQLEDIGIRREQIPEVVRRRVQS